MVGRIAGHLDKATLKRDADRVHHQLQQVMRTFGRQCRSQQQVFVSWVRQTECQLLAVGQKVGALALAASLSLEADTRLEERQYQRLRGQLRQATQADELIEQQSRRLIQGKKLSHPKIVNAYDRTIAPILKGKSNCPVQFGKKPGIIAEMATGFIFGLQLPEGNPDDASYVEPLLSQVDQALITMDRRSPLTIRSLAGDLAFRGAPLREKLHARGILTVGIPRTAEPVPRLPTPQMVQEARQQEPWKEIPSVHQVEVAYACGYSRPFVESLIEQLACRGATHLKYKGPRGALIQLTMAVIACNAATLVRIQQQRLSKRAQRFRRLFRLKPPNSLQNSSREN